MVGLPANTGAAKMKSVKTARMKNFTSAFLLQEIVNEARTLRRSGGGSLIHAGNLSGETRCVFGGRLDNLIFVLLKLRGKYTGTRLRKHFGQGREGEGISCGRAGSISLFTSWAPDLA